MTNAYIRVQKDTPHSLTFTDIIAVVRQQASQHLPGVHGVCNHFCSKKKRKKNPKKILSLKISI